MRREWVVVWCVAACGGDDGGAQPDDAMAMTEDGASDAAQDAAPAACDPVAQQGCADGEKCTWVQNVTTPPSLACAPSGTVQMDQACTRTMIGTDSVDNCAAGLYCSSQRCTPICALGGGACAANHACEEVPNATGSQSAGICTATCEPFADNDFDGDGTQLTRAGTACTEPAVGCVGFPSLGTSPKTTFKCYREDNYPTRYEHRDAALSPVATSCSQGYAPLLQESTGNTTAVCVAMCKPMNCFSGNCGTSNANRLGQAPNRCNDTDRRGAFDTSAGGEHCQFMWYWEVDPVTKVHLPSAHSDSVGYCYDHSKYLYDTNNDTVRDTPYPACAQLADGWGTGTNPADPLTYWGAADFGCVDSTRLPVMANGKTRVMPRGPRLDVRPLYER